MTCRLLRESSSQRTKGNTSRPAALWDVGTAVAQRGVDNKKVPVALSVSLRKEPQVDGDVGHSVHLLMEPAGHPATVWLLSGLHPVPPSYRQVRGQSLG